MKIRYGRCKRELTGMSSLITVVLEGMFVMLDRFIHSNSIKPEIVYLVTNVFICENCL